MLSWLCLDEEDEDNFEELTDSTDVESSENQLNRIRRSEEGLKVKILFFFKHLKYVRGLVPNKKNIQA